MLVVFPEYFADNEPETVRRFGRDLRRNFQRIPNCRRSTLQIDPCEFEITDATPGICTGGNFQTVMDNLPALLKKATQTVLFVAQLVA
jgi:hypothetical protein